jgi:creatinine amidohydrolase
MQWLELTSERLPEAIEKVRGVCVLPLGSIERHGAHLPLGTDTLVIDAVARQAARREPAVVFPTMYFGQIAEARHCAGTVSLDHELLLRLLGATLDEIGRNGFTKILIANGHGGNNGLLSYALFSLLQKRRSYVVYLASETLLPADAARWQQLWKGADGHAGVSETSCVMHVCPDSVRLQDVRTDADAAPRRTLKHLGAVRNSLWWYGDYPTHISSPPRGATARLGRFLVSAMARALARDIKLVKSDAVSAELAGAFYTAAEHGGQSDQRIRTAR